MRFDKNETPQDVMKYDKRLGIGDDPETLNSPIGAWLYSLRDVPFSQWTDFDVARAMRQDVFMEQVIPRAFVLLEDEPLVGAWDFGEVLKSFASVPAEYWEQHPEQQMLATEVAKAALEDSLIEAVSEENVIIISTIASGIMPITKD